MSFDYEVFTTRNFGFVSEAEQARLRNGAVLVAGGWRHGRSVRGLSGPRRGGDGWPSPTSTGSRSPT